MYSFILYMAYGHFLHHGQGALSVGPSFERFLGFLQERSAKMSLCPNCFSFSCWPIFSLQQFVRISNLILLLAYVESCGFCPGNKFLDPVSPCRCLNDGDWSQDLRVYEKSLNFGLFMFLLLFWWNDGFLSLYLFKL